MSLKFALTSDIHLDFHLKGLSSVIDPIISKSEEADVLLIAGDLAEFNDKMRGVVRDVLGVFAKHYKYVVAVTGNHEYWHNTFDGVRKFTKELENEIPNLIYLDCELTSIKGVKIYGGTLWFPYSEMTHMQEKRWPDFRLVRGKSEIYDSSTRFKALFPSGNVDLVISHHLPSYNSVGPGYVGDNTNCFYVNNCEELFPQVKVWVHGHTHDPTSYTFGDTRVLCKPYGYFRDFQYVPLIFEV